MAKETIRQARIGLSSRPILLRTAITRLAPPLLLLCLLLAALAGCNQPPLIPPPPDTGPEGEAAELFQGLYEPWRLAGEPAEPMRLMERLEHYGVPGVQIAVVDEGELRWSKAWGLAEGTLEDGRTMETSTLLQAGSISKLFAATAALRAVSRVDDESDLASRLDAEIAESFGSGITLRRLLSHTAGIDTPGFVGYARGEPVPELEQILAGEEPAKHWPIQQTVPAGEQWRYSGGGYEIVEDWLEETTGRDYAKWLREEIFTPLAMTSSGFEAPSPDAVALGHGGDGQPIDGGFRIYPERAAAGLWSTAEELTAWVTDVQKAQAGKPRRRLDREAALAMLTPQEPGGWGLGPQLGGEGHASYFAHLGSNAGYVGLVVGFKSSGHGAVILTNGAGGVGLIREIVAGLATVHDWPAFKPTAREAVDLDAEALESVAGRFLITSLPGLDIKLRVEAGEESEKPRLVLETFGKSGTLLAENADLFFDIENGYEVRIEGRDVDGQAQRVSLGYFPSYRFIAEREVPPLFPIGQASE